MKDTRPAGPPGSHVDPNQLAAFAESRLRGAEAVGVRNHLAMCNECREAYEYAVRFSSVGEGREDLAALRESEVAMAPPRRARKSPPRQLVVTMGVLTAAACFALITRVLPPFDPDAPGRAPITELLVARSALPGIVFPGVEQRIEHTVELRGMTSEASVEVDTAIARLAGRLREGRIPRADIRWLVAGYLATDQLSLARSTLELLPDRVRDDVDLDVLAAVLEARDGDPHAAVVQLRRIARSQPRHWVARYNLAVALGWSGNADAALRELVALRRVTRRQGQLAKLEQLERSLRSGPGSASEGHPRPSGSSLLARDSS